MEDDDAVRFATNLYFAKEGDGEVEILVLRSGEPSNACSVRVCTHDLSGQAGCRYARIDQTLEFAPGQTDAKVTVPILTDSAWHTCEEFAVKLLEPQHCAIRGGTCRVKIIDLDYFPDNELAQEIEFEDLELVPLRRFASSFLKLCWHQPGVPWKSALSVAISLMHNVYFLLTTYLKVYLINILLAKAAGESQHASDTLQAASADEGVTERRLIEGVDRLNNNGGLFGNDLLVPGNLQATAAVVGMMYIIPFGILHILDLIQARLGLSGGLKTMLISALFRRFMSFKPEVRQQVNDAEISMTCVRDVPHLVSSGVMNCFHLVEIACKLLTTMVFLLVEDQLAIVPFCVYPLLAALWICFRQPALSKAQETKLKTGNQLVKGVHQACMNYNMILDYRKRSKAVDRFSSYALQYRKAMSACHLMDINNGRFFPWLTTISMGIYAIVGVEQLRIGATNIGTFVATFGIFVEVGHELERGYEVMMEMIHAFHVVKDLTRLLNLPTDDADRMTNIQHRLKEGMEARERKLQELMVQNQSESFVHHRGRPSGYPADQSELRDPGPQPWRVRQGRPAEGCVRLHSTRQNHHRRK
ncbi:unnamed protein product [Effrenium voratum]|nr:unnamed protein product [Effrenium voratum]